MHKHLQNNRQNSNETKSNLKLLFYVSPFQNSAKELNFDYLGTAKHM